MSIWWRGPDFLRQQVVEYKKPKHLITRLEEVKVNTCTLDVTFWNRFSTLQRMLRVTAYCRRFLKVNSQGVRSKHLTKPELDEALEICIKKSQEEGFAKELE
ncbi:hypothetical protein HF086_003779 [Spodoptera exigua]|uniref:Uncharacterized protein n=1 Tax=Spodoptera exigua TaxID=7107 RepID=A0A922MXJ7_SPOEX|nr:hypothetical protein HF086_003779 [Spodoptera exigua]